MICTGTIGNCTRLPFVPRHHVWRRDRDGWIVYTHESQTPCRLPLRQAYSIAIRSLGLCFTVAVENSTVWWALRVCVTCSAATFISLPGVDFIPTPPDICTHSGQAPSTGYHTTFEFLAVRIFRFSSVSCVHPCAGVPSMFQSAGLSMTHLLPS